MRFNRFTRIAAALVALSMVLGTGCKRKTAEERGKAAADEKAGFVKGVGDSLKDKGREAAQSMGGGVVQVWDGFKEGVEGTPVGQVRITPELEGYGAQTTRVQLTSGGVINAYVIAEKPFKRELRLKALDKDDREIGRARAVVDFPADHAEYVDFEFDERTPMSQVTCFEMSVGPIPDEAAEDTNQQSDAANSDSAAAPSE
jgi:hypothetical protein